MEANGRRFLNEHVLAGRALRIKRAPSLVRELANRVIEASLEEHREFWGEAEIPADVGNRGGAHTLVVALPQLGEPTGEASAEMEDQDSEEGDRLDLPLPLD